MPGQNSSAKGNPASHRMSNPNNKSKRSANKAKNERLEAKGEHPKQIRNAENEALHKEKVRFGGLSRSERRKLEAWFGVDIERMYAGTLPSEKEEITRNMRRKLVVRKKHLIPDALTPKTI